MASMKKRAREKCTGKFVLAPDKECIANVDGDASPKQRIGRPKNKK